MKTAKEIRASGHRSLEALPYVVDGATKQSSFVRHHIEHLLGLGLVQHAPYGALERTELGRQVLDLLAPAPALAPAD